ncbi:hypothetical protein DXG03_006738 [Asterophora parasitica]|uniref:Uncharacterized protein n=1 Tax=Asterophora parasitica TaxID=117018 RepID=A0A9P7K986_9AGAR|nr:hypothetical protein DXG03_006738 [Asterophora parasitica]
MNRGMASEPSPIETKFEVGGGTLDVIPLQGQQLGYPEQGGKGQGGSQGSPGGGEMFRVGEGILEEGINK